MNKRKKTKKIHNHNNQRDFCKEEILDDKRVLVDKNDAKRSLQLLERVKIPTHMNFK